MQLLARDILNWNESQLWTLPEGEITVAFDDGPVCTNYGEIITSWYMWEVIRQYPKTPLTKAMFVGDRAISGDFHTDIFSVIYWEAFEAYNREIDLEHVALLIFQSTNAIHNSIVSNMGEYLTSKDIFDYIDLIEYPKIKELNDACKPTQTSITQTHNDITDIIYHEPELRNNAIVKVAKSKLVPMQQILQCISAVGFRTDKNSEIFPEPILDSITSGIDKLHDSMIESRSATKALSFAKDPLRIAEYFNRKLQLVCAYIQRVHKRDDCGSTMHIERIIRKNDLKNMSGNYYKVDGGYLPLLETDKHLVGKKLYLRNALFCRHSDRYGVCQKCFGELAYNIPDGTIIGQVSATALCEKTTQIIMSTKHLDGNSNVGSIEFSGAEAEYVYAEKEDVDIYLMHKHAGKNLQIIINAAEASRLNDITYARNVKTLNIHALTGISEIRVVIQTKNRLIEEDIGVSVGSRLSSLSHDALEYLLQYGWTLNAFGNIEINLTNWDYSKPLLVLPRRHKSMIECVTTIESVIIGNGKKKKSGKGELSALHGFTNPEEALIALYELVTDSVDVNITHLGVIARAMLVRDLKLHDYGLPTRTDPFTFGKFREIMTMRSLGAKMAYEDQVAAIYNPLSYLIKNRPPHPIDKLLVK